jgi:hypothetical protein
MVLEELPQNLIVNLWTILQALGIFLILYIVFNTINVLINKNKQKELSQINQNLLEIKDLLSKKK